MQNDETSPEDGGATDDTVSLPADQPSSEPSSDPVQASGRFDFWIPAMMLVLGLLLGGGLVWIVAMDGSDDGSTTADATPTVAGPTVTTTSTTTDLEVTVPAECLDLADNTQEILDLIDQAVAAVSDLDAGALSDVVSQLETAQT
ncbi:MAG TPA: hypothetical protein VMX11_01580, partial [Actinomycetes bacterium]|nr:hypothetical protein [Actinomycetes bacterium]